MKLFKKGLAALLTVVTALVMVTPAFAEGGYTVSVKSGDTHTYEVYQILTGDLSEDGTLSNVKAGQNFNSTKGDAAAAAEAIAASTKTGQALADEIAGYVTGTAYGTVSADNPLANVPAGYYLFKDVTPNLAEGDSYSTNVVEVVKSVEIVAKKDTVTFEKKIKDTNDTTGKTTEWQDSADYDIGDAVPFQLKGTVPSNYDSYSTYYYQFTDQMEKSLTFNKDSVKVFVDGTEITTGFTVSDGSTIQSGAFADGTQFSVTFEDLKKVAAVKAGSVITVEYTATLNENAVLGQQGNVNQARLKYSNNPNQGGEGETGETPWDTVIVFTYQVTVNKVDQDKKPLAGAEFTLYKKLADGTTKEIKAVTATSGTSFDFKGLDDGDYVLKETKTPEGYNTVADIEFTITAEHKIEWAAGVDRTTILTELKGGSLGDGKVDTGVITTQVENRKGSTLPSTGGMGTTIFYVAGSILVVAAGVLFVVKKRMTE